MIAACASTNTVCWRRSDESLEAANWNQALITFGVLDYPPTYSKFVSIYKTKRELEAIPVFATLRKVTTSPLRIESRLEDLRGLPREA